MEFLSGMQEALNLHPMVVHFPIVILLLALGAEIVFQIKHNENFGKAAGLLLNLAAVSALVAMYFGYRAADILGHETPGHDLVHAHRDIMVWFTWLTVGAAILFQFVKASRKGVLRLAALIILTGIMVVGTDRGAGLVFNHGIGTHQTMFEHHEAHHHDDDEDQPGEEHDKHEDEHEHSEGHTHSH